MWGKKDLFKGLAMEQLEKEWIEYPVIHLDFTRVVIWPSRIITEIITIIFIIFSLLTDYLVDVEVHTPKGRVDVVLLTGTDLYIIELKLDKSAQAAMQ